MVESGEMLLTDKHWNLIHLIRECYYERSSVPEPRKIFKWLKSELVEGKQYGNMYMLYFPYGYAREGCKIAGMRQPNNYG